MNINTKKLAKTIIPLFLIIFPMVFSSLIEETFNADQLSIMAVLIIAYFGDIRTLISETSGQHIGIIRTAYRKHPDTLPG